MANPTGKGGPLPGEVRNPKGRPTKEREEKYLDVTLTAVTFEDWKKIVHKARDQALKGDAVARKWLSDYLIGPPVQRQEHTGKDGETLTIEIVKASSVKPDSGDQ